MRYKDYYRCKKIDLIISKDIYTIYFQMSRQTNFQKVIDFNTQFGVKIHSTHQPTIFDSEPNNVEFAMKLIREEVRELEEAVKNKDYVETVDALADILYVVYGMGTRIGVNLDEVFDIVHENNMSKLCSSEDEAKESVQYYISNKEKLGYDSPAYRLADDGKHYVVYNQSTKKVLKSIKWQPVDLSFVMKTEQLGVSNLVKTI
jgi:predicted HAD superfamily Cof-like phosphohydrolase